MHHVEVVVQDPVSGSLYADDMHHFICIIYMHPLECLKVTLFNFEFVLPLIVFSN